MKKGIMILGVLALIGLSAFGGYKVTSDNNTITVSQQADLMTESWQEVVIIQNCNVLYSGAVDELDDNLLNMQVVEVANCEDSFAITLFVE